MTNYDLIQDRIDIDERDQFCMECVPGTRRSPKLCPRPDIHQMCNVHCAKCSIQARVVTIPMDDGHGGITRVQKTYWVISTCGARHKAKHLFKATSLHAQPPVYKEIFPNIE